MRWIVLLWTLLILGMCALDVGSLKERLGDNPFLGLAYGYNIITYFFVWAIVAMPLALLWAMFRRPKTTLTAEQPRDEYERLLQEKRAARKPQAPAKPAREDAYSKRLQTIKPLKLPDDA
jgi:hypothetical protein